MTNRTRLDPFDFRPTIGRLGRARIDRAGLSSHVLQPGEIEQKKLAPPIRIVDNPEFQVLVVPDCAEGTLSRSDRLALAAGRVLAGADGALTVATNGATGLNFASEGVDRVLVLPRSLDPFSLIAAIRNAMKSHCVKHTIFTASAQGGDRARRLAAMSGLAFAHSVVGLEEGRVVQLAGEGYEAMLAPPPIVLLAEGFEASSSVFETGQAIELVLELERKLEALSVVRYGPPLRPALEDASLVEADAILAGGNGVDDWEALSALSEVLEIPLGASRVAVDSGKVARSRQVGASGSIVTARSYLAFGISGAPQHLEGIASCEAVLAVNTDPSCAMINRADLAIVADANAVIRSLLAALGGRIA